MVDIQKAFSLQSQGLLDEAKSLYLEFLNENPQQPDVSNLLGLVYLQKEEFLNAQKYFEFATKGFPCAEYFQNLGISLYRQKKYEQSMECFSKAIEFEKENLEFVRNCAQMAKLVNQVDYAIKFFEIALEIEEKDCVGWNNLGLLYEKKHDYIKAQKCYELSLNAKKNYEALHNLGVLHRTLRNFDESVKFLKKALTFKPNHRETMISLGMSYLSKKDLKNGYRYYQYADPEVKAKYKNQWNGEKHLDSTLLVYYYAGFGDHFMFSRYLPLLKDYFKNIKVWLPIPVRDVIALNYPDIEFVKNILVDYDYSACIMELHNIMNIDFDSIPFSEGYLLPDEKKVEFYNQQYFQNENKKKIGLFWQGNPNVFPNRSIKLKELQPLFANENCEFFSFEKEDKENQIEGFSNIVDLGKTFKTFSETAAALKNIDVLITIDSAIAHLAGAMGVKTFLLLPYSSEWRWFVETDKTDWYKSVRIFKQSQPWVWNDVVERVNIELKNL